MDEKLESSVQHSENREPEPVAHVQSFADSPGFGCSSVCCAKATPFFDNLASADDYTAVESALLDPPYAARPFAELMDDIGYFGEIGGC